MKEGEYGLSLVDTLRVGGQLSDGRFEHGSGVWVLLLVVHDVGTKGKTY